MTMFSMKPKFNLAEFLAEPAKPSASRRRSTMTPMSSRKPLDEPDSEKTTASAAAKTKTP